MARFSTAGTKLYIGSAMAEVDDDRVLSDFSGLTYVEVKNTTNLGNFGDTSAQITSDEIGRDRTVKAKGTRNAGTMSVICNNNPTDPGQLAMHAAEASPSDYAFKIVFPDAPATGSAPVGSTRYFAAKVMSDPEDLGTANNFATVTFNLDINSNIVKVAATSGS